MKVRQLDVITGEITERDLTPDELASFTVPDPATIIEAKKTQVRTLREGILNRLAGIALAAQLSGDTATTTAYVTVRQGLLGITDGWPTDPAQVPALVASRYANLVAQCTPQMISAFAEVDA